MIGCASVPISTARGSTMANSRATEPCTPRESSSSSPSASRENPASDTCLIAVPTSPGTQLETLKASR